MPLTTRCPRGVCETTASIEFSRVFKTLSSAYRKPKNSSSLEDSPVSCYVQPITCGSLYLSQK